MSNLPRTTPPTAHVPHANRFSAAWQRAAEKVFVYQTRQPRKPWITEPTMTALQAARAAESQAVPEAKPLRNKAKRLARKDRVAWVHARLTEDPGGLTKNVWRMAKQQKRGFVGKRSHLMVEGKPVPWSRSHEAFRDHLQNKQWSSRLTTPQQLEAAKDMGPNQYPTEAAELLFS